MLFMFFSPLKSVRCIIRCTERHNTAVRWPKIKFTTIFYPIKYGEFFPIINQSGSNDWIYWRAKLFLFTIKINYIYVE